MSQIAEMNKMLNVVKANEVMVAAGLSRSELAKKLGVSREAVSQWFLHKAFPRPNTLLQISKLLGLSFNELVLAEDPHAPKIAFRKMKGTKTQNHHIEKAQAIGRYLRGLVPYLPFDILKMPPVLKNPSTDPAYLQRVTAQIRDSIGLGTNDTIDFQHLIRHFAELQTVMVPVSWGAKQVHENAVHIYLPDSQTTWVYLNLDTNIHDFKFWMAHELGHCLAPHLEGEEAEDFADAFASNLLFPSALVVSTYDLVKKGASISQRIAAVCEVANEQMISPYTVAKRLEEHALHIGDQPVDLGKKFAGFVTNFNKGHPKMSEVFMGGKGSEGGVLPTVGEYIERSESVFETAFFAALRRYLAEHHKGPGFIEVVLDMSPLDARALYAELT